MATFTASARRFLGRAVAAVTPKSASKQKTANTAAAPSRTRAVPTGVRIEYSPDMDGDPDPGEVVWTWVPYEDDASQGKDRPVVIIGRTGDDLAGVPLTSRDHHRSDEVPIGAGAWDRSGRPSFAKVDQLLTIDPDAVRREGSVLARNHFDDVVAGVARHHDIRRR